MSNDQIQPSVAQSKKKEVSEWMRYAKEDYDLVQHLYRGDYYPKPLEIICYHCEQATEKVVKALIVDLGKQGGLPQRHDIEFLLSQIKKILIKDRGISVTEEMREWAEKMSDFAVNVRYPNEMHIDEYKTKWAVEKMEFFFKWASDALTKESD